MHNLWSTGTSGMIRSLAMVGQMIDSTSPPFAVAIPSPARFDAEVHPSKRQTILPCDASQLEAILAINSGASLVLDDPLGTGKSQTIANVIAECLAG